MCGIGSCSIRDCERSKTKKAGVAEPLKGFRHAGLLFISPFGISRIALYLVVRKKSLLIESSKKHFATHHDSTDLLVSCSIRKAMTTWLFFGNCCEPNFLKREQAERKRLKPQRPVKTCSDSTLSVGTQTDCDVAHCRLKELRATCRRCHEWCCSSGADPRI